MTDTVPYQRVGGAVSTWLRDLRRKIDNGELGPGSPEAERIEREQREHAAAERWAHIRAQVRRLQPRPALYAVALDARLRAVHGLPEAILACVGEQDARQALEAKVAPWLASEPREPSEAWRVLRASLTRGRMALLAGPTGVGKTTAAHRWGLLRALMGSTVAHLGYDGWRRLHDSHEAYQAACGVGVLLFDELRAWGGASPWVREQAKALVDARWASGRTTIGCYQGTAAEAVGALGAEVVERLGGVMALSGHSYRRTW